MVGNGMAGVRTLEELVKLAPDAYDITVFGAEPHPNYNRILLSPVLSGEQTIDEIMLNDREWYAANGITLTWARRSRRSTACNGRWSPPMERSRPYDRLLLATGSSPVILPIPATIFRVSLPTATSPTPMR
jgi:nitrite reductase (NADH) large subunit